MIEIVQTGQAGKTKLLFDMHRLRSRVFKEQLGWNVSVNEDGLETDQFDLPETLYLLAVNAKSQVIGTWRLLPSTGPTMIRDVWPKFDKQLPMPRLANVWEVSRFAVLPVNDDPIIAKMEIQTAIAEMFCALTEFCLKVGISEIFTFYDERISRVLERINCKPCKVTVPQEIYGSTAQVGIFQTDADMLRRLQDATGIKNSLLESFELPPYFSLANRRLANA